MVTCHPINRLFTNLEGEQKNIRTATRNGALWFVLADVCAVLGLANASMVVKQVSDNEKGKLDLALGTRADGTRYRRGSDPTCVSESGIYKLIMRSDKPNARPFQDWVTKVVLPTIRKEGVYIRGEEKIATAGSLSELEDLREQMLNLAGRKALSQS